MPVPLLIASRLGAILTPDDVRERQKKPVPKGFGAQEDFFPADFADVLQAHVEWCIDSEVIQEVGLACHLV